MQIKNLDAAKLLVRRHRNITEEDLNKFDCDDECPSEALSLITGFGCFSSCCLCKECCSEDDYDPDCSQCLYSRDGSGSSYLMCVEQPTYTAIRDAESISSLYEAIQARADYIESLIKEIENDY